MTMQFCIILQRMAPNCRGKCMQTACQKLNSNFSLELLKHFPKSELGCSLPLNTSQVETLFFSF